MGIKVSVCVRQIGLLIVSLSKEYLLSPLYVRNPPKNFRPTDPASKGK